MKRKSLDKTIREQRIRCGLSQEQVASYICVSRTTYCLYENGVRRPSIDTIFHLSAVFDINPMVLFFPLIPDYIISEYPGYAKDLEIRCNIIKNPDCEFLMKYHSLTKSEQNTIRKVIRLLRS